MKTTKVINPPLRRFWSKVDVKFEVNDAYERCYSEFCEGCQNGTHCWKRWPCWNWKAKAKRMGYGAFQIYPKKTENSHRMTWILCGNGVVPKNNIIMHLCDNRLCCNPKHLRLGTKKDNYQDSANKGRNTCVWKQGGYCPSKKLREEQVLEIVKLLKSGMQGKDIAALFKISPSTISEIKNGRKWRWLTYQ